ncbi:MAG: DUF1993 domain-containing protein [Rhodanobacter sp.]
MNQAMYTTSVPVFKQFLGSLDSLLAKAEAHAQARKIDPVALTQSRIFPDMFPLTMQVQIACNFASGVTARLAGVEPPPFDKDALTFEQMRALIKRTNDFVTALKPAQFEGSDQREIVLNPGTPKERRFNGQTYLLAYGMPQFFFHLTTTYALLRHAGVEIGKSDFVGQY